MLELSKKVFFAFGEGPFSVAQAESSRSLSFLNHEDCSSVVTYSRYLFGYIKWEFFTPPAIIDADELQRDPETTLRRLCYDLEIPFQASMFIEVVPIPEDGTMVVQECARINGFPSPKKYPLDLLEQSLPLYNSLRSHVKHNSSLLSSPLPPPSLPILENAKLFAWVGDEMLPREMAKVSVFDSVVQGGDSVWEGLRIYKGKILQLEEHIDRLFDSAKALAFDNLPSLEEQIGSFIDITCSKSYIESPIKVGVNHGGGM